MKTLLIIACFCLSLSAPAMDRLAALSQIETGDNDRVVGRVGELSRWQVRPEILRAHRITRAQAQNAAAVKPLVRSLLDERCRQFAALHRRPPTDFEYYVLWNAPAQVLADGHQISATVTERARRFSNLCTV